MVFLCGALSHEGVSHEKDSSLNACDSGAAWCNLNRFICRRRGSATHVLAIALSGKVTAQGIQR
jgi:hypothetical protein